MIPEKKHITNAYDRNDYYKAILLDYLSMSAYTTPNITQQIPKINLPLYNACIITKRNHRELQLAYSVLISMYIHIYQNHKDIFTLSRVYQGIKEQQKILFGLKRSLQIIPLPLHYIPAIQYQLKKFNDRIQYLKPIMQTYINMSPLADYEKTLPEEISLLDDIWNHTSEWEDEKPEIRKKNRETYIQHILTSVNIHSVNEARIKYEKQQDKRIDSGKQKEIQKKKDRAMDIASYKADILWKNIRTGRTILANKLYSKCLNMPEAKIFLLVRVSSAYQNRGTGLKSVWYIDENGELTAAPTKVQVYPVDAVLPNKIQKLIDNNTFVYTELIIK